MMCVSDLILEHSCAEKLAAAGIYMIIQALHRLRSTTAPELLVILTDSGGEIHLSTIDNSSECVTADECYRVRQLILSLGGVHDFERSSTLTESTFSFLLRPGHRRFVDGAAGEGAFADGSRPDMRQQRYLPGACESGALEDVVCHGL